MYVKMLKIFYLTCSDVVTVLELCRTDLLIPRPQYLALHPCSGPNAKTITVLVDFISLIQLLQSDCINVGATLIQSQSVEVAVAERNPIFLLFASDC